MMNSGAFKLEPPFENGGQGGFAGGTSAAAVGIPPNPPLEKGGAENFPPTVNEGSLPFPKGGQEGFLPITPAALAAAFRHIAVTRMAGVSLVNPALSVEALGFRDIDGNAVGILITPWCMNLISLPGTEADWMAWGSGTKHDLTLPSGDYEFLTAHEDALGPYLSTSLFSPLFEFSDMEQARAVAEAVLLEILALGEIQWVMLLPARLEAGQILTESNPS